MTTTKAQTLNKDYLTTKEAAAYLSVSPWKVCQLVKEGKLHGTKLGDGPNSRLRISSVSIEKMLESNSTKLHLGKETRDGR